MQYSMNAQPNIEFIAKAAPWCRVCARLSYWWAVRPVATPAWQRGQMLASICKVVPSLANRYAVLSCT